MSERSPLVEREAGRKGKEKESVMVFRFVLNNRARLRESAGLYAHAMRTNARECIRMGAMFANIAQSLLDQCSI